MNRKLDIGCKREWIVIQQVTETADSEGQPIPVWSEFDSVWARVEFLSVQEFPEMQKINAKAVVRFYIDYREDLDEKMRIFWRSKYWNIHGFEPEETKFDMALLASRTE